MKKVKVAIGSKNPVKLQATEKAFGLVWPDKDFEFVSIETKSGVSDQPMSDQETIKGATNRAKQAQKETGADFGVGLEGGIVKVDNQYFARAWMAVINKKGEIGLGSTLSAPLPDKFMKLVNNGIELGKAHDIISGRENTKQQEGYFGLVSSNLVTREKGYINAIVMALAKFKKPDIFE